MGYCMDYKRVLSRNGLHGDYSADYPDTDYDRLRSFIRGDLRRLEHDQRDEMHLAAYARQTGLTTAQVKTVLDLLFSDGCVHMKPCNEGERR